MIIVKIGGGEESTWRDHRGPVGGPREVHHRPRRKRAAGQAGRGLGQTKQVITSGERLLERLF